jgi:hypothetical protein
MTIKISEIAPELGSPFNALVGLSRFAAEFFVYF